MLNNTKTDFILKQEIQNLLNMEYIKVLEICKEEYDANCSIKKDCFKNQWQNTNFNLKSILFFLATKMKCELDIVAMEAYQILQEENFIGISTLDFNKEQNDKFNDLIQLDYIEGIEQAMAVLNADYYFSTFAIN